MFSECPRSMIIAFFLLVILAGSLVVTGVLLVRMCSAFQAGSPPGSEPPENAHDTQDTHDNGQNTDIECVPDQQIQVRIGNRWISAEVADTPCLREKGLMYRERLDNGSGMLFIYDEPGDHSFWMKNVLIPLDIIWIGPENTIVHIEYGQPCMHNECPTYSSPLPARYVLEVNGHFTDTHNVTVGDRVTFQKV